MAERTQRSITVDAPSTRVMDVIADFDAYPTWVSAAKSVEVLATGADGRAERVKFVLDAGMVKDTYELSYQWAPDGSSVSWELVSGDMQKSQTGSYSLSDNADGGTEVTYELAVDLNIPMIGLFKRKAEKVITDTALKELKKRVEG
ncbi:SRPBCC family protein [Rhodococcus sovatensis]|uniref:SRPBCC family protein n=1 Tax=Rhodococcus sovatensis TaxID=1805840 RepID=A0ABZ2PM81_9NOCA